MSIISQKECSCSGQMAYEGIIPFTRHKSLCWVETCLKFHGGLKATRPAGPGPPAEAEKNGPVGGVWPEVFGPSFLCLFISLEHH